MSRLPQPALIERDINPLLMRLLAGVRLFEDLARDQLVQLLSLADKVTFEPGAVVFAEGDAGDCMHLVIGGAVEVHKIGLDGEARRLAVIAPGEPVGEMALAEPGPRTAHVRALERSVTLQISRAQLARHPRIEATLYRNMARLLARRLRHTNEELLAVCAGAPKPAAC